MSQVSSEEALQFGKLARDDLKLHPPEGYYRDRQVISEVSLDLYRGGTPYLLYVDKLPVSLNITRLSSKKRISAWGRYVNCNLTYTLTEHRFRGYSSGLYLHLQKRFADMGYERLKSLIGSWPGFRLHINLNHVIWGQEELGHFVVDTPLTTKSPPTGIPPQIRSYHLSDDWTEQKMLEGLSNPKGFFRCSDSDIREALSRHTPILGHPIVEYAR